eukprot:6175288-Pleurochrysis_carterae.AAC.3
MAPKSSPPEAGGAPNESIPPPKESISPLGGSSGAGGSKSPTSSTTGASEGMPNGSSSTTGASAGGASRKSSIASARPTYSPYSTCIRSEARRPKLQPRAQCNRKRRMQLCGRGCSDEKAADSQEKCIELRKGA